MSTKTEKRVGENFEVTLLAEPEYHRNGIGGEPFYSAMILVTEDLKHQGLLATWRTGEDGKVAPDTCRVVNIGDKSQHYRGDRIGGKLKEIVRRVE